VLIVSGDQARFIWYKVLILSRLRSPQQKRHYMGGTNNDDGVLDCLLGLRSFVYFYRPYTIQYKWYLFAL